MNGYETIALGMKRTFTAIGSSHPNQEHWRCLSKRPTARQSPKVEIDRSFFASFLLPILLPDRW